MRILWLDSLENPWIEDNGWEELKKETIDVAKESLSEYAKRQLSHNQFDLVVVRAEIPGSLEVLEEMKQHPLWKNIPTILTSTKWDKKEFKQHAKTVGGAKNYVRIPVPVKAFIKMLKDLFEGKLPDSSNSSKAFLGLEPSVGQQSKSLHFSAQPTPPVPESLDKTSQILTKGTAIEVTTVTPTGTKRPVYEPKVAIPLQPAVPISEAGVEVLREYLHIREQELAYAINEREQLLREKSQIEQERDTLKQNNYELEHRCNELARKAQKTLDEYEVIERKLESNHEQTELEKKNYQEQIENLEHDLKEAREQYENLKERVRKDIFKIQAREKELEAKLELTRKDTETILEARDREVLDLKRKINALESDIDHVQDAKLRAERDVERYMAKLGRVVRTLQLAMGMMETAKSDDEMGGESEPAGFTNSAPQISTADVTPVDLQSAPEANPVTSTQLGTFPHSDEEKTIPPDLQNNELKAEAENDADKTMNIKIDQVLP